ncbi:methylated-DNA--[protein]-cysteine S-methyltransferase [Rhizobium sp. RU36D]|uniref:methylated-DNA--[protein]-cysteine S-methyltransferase n=1 Tax=Rhizobium sp. RU36D TaxID=1907415 RepID=UPI0009D7C7D8|nr:methylated-DNA--[protein]-cysteine S-methyltransferase [Rhizobium sp. RU36D]SMD04344.1 O-6-methylguanine DNA methyltransferase [Rhizobium sp. RU36D]
MFYAEWIETPLGDMVAIADAASLHVLEFRDRLSRQEDIAALELRMGAPVSVDGNAVTAQATSDMADYFSGRSATFSVPLSPAGSDFEKSVWRELLQVPLAETCSYGDIARKVGGLETVRAVGKANGANPIAIIIPCHRCIGSDGSLTGYGGGLWRKKWLLRHEGQMRPVGLFAS